MGKILPFFCLALLTGCAAPLAVIAAGSTTVATYSVTGKSPMDYGLSKYRHQDCDIRNPKRHDGLYCVDEGQEVAAQEPEVYCYTTLGTPDCTSQLDPHNNGDTPIVGPQGQVSRGLPDYSSAHHSSEEQPITLEPVRSSAPPMPAAREVGAVPTPHQVRDSALEGS